MKNILYIKLSLLVLTVSVLAGCASKYGNHGNTVLCDPDVSKLGLDTYIAEANCAKSSPGIAAANFICSEQNKEVFVTNIQNNDVVFQCLNKNDSEYTRPVYQRPANTVIQDNRN